MSKNTETTKEKTTLRVSGLPGGSEAWWLLTHASELGRCLVLTASDEAAQTLHDDLQALEHWRNPLAPGGAVYFAEEEMDARVTALSRWAAADAAEPPAQFLIAAWEPAQEPLPPPEEFKKAHRRLRWGDRLDRAAFLADLSRRGYERADTVEQVGELAVRGEVVDLWSPGWDGPARILWPYDRIESIRKIDMATQRSSDALDSALVRPAALRGAGDGGLGIGKSEISSTSPQPPASSPGLLDYLGPDGTLFESALPEEARIPWEGRRYVRADLGPADREEPYLGPPPFGAEANRVEMFAKAVQGWVRDGWRAAVFCHNPGEQERLEEILLEQDRGLAKFLENKQIDFPIGFLARGFLDPTQKIAVLSNGEIFGRYRRRLRLPKFTGGKAITEIAQLSKGDYVVHERFGVGRYKGLERVRAGGVEADYLRLEYRGGDRVFVPLFEFRQVQKHIGTDGKTPKLSSLDTATWDRTKEEVQASVAELARELLARAAKRAAIPGIAYPPDSHLEKEFGASFLYELTPDQAKAIEEVKNDMIRPRPMDRLVCGDVGYGKTEVAMRAAFKAVAAGRQVAVLVPTTILAEQHGRNFRERFADYPVSVAVLSRFAKPGEEKRVLADLRRGVIDILIGTHRLLSPDVTFKNLGLIIVDEEHRFGVKQKERLMAFRDVVDVLALSATPIPRTLGAAMGGVKALSVIETPPEGRLPIATHVGPFDQKIVLAAVEHELRRGGQVFYVHNRVGTINERKKWLENVLKEHGFIPSAGPQPPASGPGFSICLAHGKMTGTQLEKTMWEFLHRKFNILLSTSIIESGLDIPSVNTLIVEEAEDFGLAQLYQLRGRVGRERQKAYCYLFYSPGTGLTEEAQKRLGALKEFASLGSGFRLAMRDLEIRGAGNLLGPEQHGFMNAVGMDLYGQLLTEEIKRQQGEVGEARRAGPEPALELPVSAFLPEDYLPSEAERVVFYKRLLDASPADLDALKEELADRCGPLPEPAARLFEVAALRHAARDRKVSKIAATRKGLEIRFLEDARFPPDVLDGLVKTHGARFSFLPGQPDRAGEKCRGGTAFGMRFTPPLPENLLEWTRNFLSTLG